MYNGSFMLCVRKSEYLFNSCDEIYVSRHCLFVCQHCLVLPTIFTTNTKTKQESADFRVAKFKGLRQNCQMSKYFAFPPYFACTITRTISKV